MNRLSSSLYVADFQISFSDEVLRYGKTNDFALHLSPKLLAYSSCQIQASGIMQCLNSIILYRNLKISQYVPFYTIHQEILFSYCYYLNPKTCRM